MFPSETQKIAELKKLCRRAAKWDKKERIEFWISEMSCSLAKTIPQSESN